ncbi:MAG: hypothetical protein RL710_1234 [Pseudomonadota bacterium]
MRPSLKALLLDDVVHADLPSAIDRLRPIIPISGFTALMCDCVDLRSVDIIFFVHNGVRKAIQVVNPETIFTVWAALLVF